ncbi:MAG: hypothetical protein LBF56_00755 [Holosporales bacterium]|nr:hypothetical protein [Holosporales bacterium]
MCEQSRRRIVTIRSKDGEIWQIIATVFMRPFCYFVACKLDTEGEIDLLMMRLAIGDTVYTYQYKKQ